MAPIQAWDLLEHLNEEILEALPKWQGFFMFLKIDYNCILRGSGRDGEFAYICVQG